MMNEIKITGTEKQVAWATDIRAAYIAGGIKGATEGVSAFRLYASGQMKAAGITPADLMPRRAELLALIPVAYDRICATPAAAWWIDNRGNLDAVLATEWVAMVRAALGK
jgi:hypothetical protein